MTERQAMDGVGNWLLLMPQISVASSKLRVMLGRRLQGIGALQFQTNLWILPYSAEHEKVIANMLADLKEQGGSGLVFRSQVGSDEMHQSLIVHFQSIQHNEYATFICSCQEFLTAVEQQVLNDNWNFDVLEEIERSLQKLNNRLARLQQRDFFPDDQSETARTMHARCSQALYEFAISVYTYHDISVNAEEAKNTIEHGEGR
ncbi:hypothetical protein KDH_05690 [Dictyobacter sp. S3.2.2.5]|uniref:ChrB N-terminal domain-containing protein n=1 Tax=Dictyobacter halimunensis TaxID=3026934 RepID=A0ABQ6FKG9_9CHLR|nr:hypothetical protein KDH_05690 [Dictyobacter sp. S3.2.2.5]